MNAIQKKDFAPILKAFPDSNCDDGIPNIRFTVIDVECDPIVIEVFEEGTFRVLTQNENWLLLDLSVLAEIQKKVRKAHKLIRTWDESESGQSFYAGS